MVPALLTIVLVRKSAEQQRERRVLGQGSVGRELEDFSRGVLVSQMLPVVQSIENPRSAVLRGSSQGG